MENITMIQSNKIKIFEEQKYYNRLVIELDGGYHETSEQKQKDA